MASVDGTECYGAAFYLMYFELGSSFVVYDRRLLRLNLMTDFGFDEVVSNLAEVAAGCSC